MFLEVHLNIQVRQREEQMKIKERYKFFNHARRDYSKIFARNYEFTQLSYKKLAALLKNSKYAGYCEYWYCCHGLYNNCWIDPFEEGVWSMSQNDVDMLLTAVLKESRRWLRNKYRTLLCEDSYGTHIILVTRDVQLCDYVITLANDNYCGII